MSKYKFILFLTLFVSVGTANAQPFGIEMGTKLNQLEIIKQIGPNHWYVKPPKSHPEFENVVVESTPGSGVCLVKGSGITHGNDAFGVSIRDAFSTIRDQVALTYGSSSTADFLRTGSIWKDRNEWVMSIRQHERVYEAAWDKAAKSKLSNGVVEILLDVVALSRDDSYLSLQYRFSNFDKCEQEIKENAAKTF